MQPFPNLSFGIRKYYGVNKLKNKANVNHSAFSQNEVAAKDRSPRSLLGISITAIVLAEVTEMVILAFLHLPEWWMNMLFDVAIMALVITPILYFLPYRNLLAEIRNRKKGENLLRTVLENLPVGVVITDRNGNILHGNRASKNIWAGLRLVGPEEYGQYRAWWIGSGEYVKAEEWGAARAINRGETSLNEEVEIETFDGQRKTILNSAAPIYDDVGDLQGAVVVNQDITSRRQIEQELLRNYELMEKYFSSISTLIAYMERNYNFIRVNDSYARSAGHPADYFIGKNYFVLYPHDENMQIFNNVVATGEPFFVLEKPFDNPEFPERGTTYWNWGLQPVHNADGLVEGLVLSLVDVTERKLAELRLDAQNQELLELSATEHRQRQLAEGLMNASIAVNASLKLDEVFKQILISLQQSLPHKMANVLLIEGDQVYIAHQWTSGGVAGSDLPLISTFKLSEYPELLKVQQTCQPLVVPDVTLVDDWIPMRGMEWTRSFLVAPLIIGKEITGMIILHCDQSNAYTEESVNRLMAFAAPAAVAIHNARLYSAELRAHEIAETLNEASLALTQTLDLDTVMNALLDFVYRLVPYDGAYITLLQDEISLSVRAIRRNVAGVYPGLNENSTFELWDKPYLQAVITTGKSLNLANTYDQSTWEEAPEGANTRSWVGVPMIVSDKPIGMVVLAKMEPNFFQEQHVQVSEAIIAQAAVVIQNAWLYEQVRTGHVRLQSIFRRLVAVQENERRFIARELHDETSQALTSLMIKLRLLDEEADQPDQVRQRTTDLRKGIDGVLENLHRLAMNLRPATLDLVGLVPTLEQMVKDFGSQAGIHIQFKVTGTADEKHLTSELETTIYRIFQEALNNVVQHANAKKVDVLLEFLDRKIIAIVEDDGMGYDTGRAYQSGRLGLVGMQERAQMAGGSLQIESNPGEGTTVVAEIPYDD